MKEQVDFKKIMLQNGVLLGLAMVFISIVSYVGEIPFQEDKLLEFLMLAFSFLMMIVFIIIGIRKYKSKNSGFVDLRQCLKIGLGITVIGIIIARIYEIVFLKYIAPEYNEQLFMLQKQMILKFNPDITLEEIAMEIEMRRKLFIPLRLFLGFIFSFVIGLVMRKEELRK